MFKQRYVVLLISILFFTIGVVVFCYKTELKFELICSTEIRSDFYPDAYCVINDDTDKREYFSSNSDTKILSSQCIDSIDVSKFSYVVVYGRKVKRMYYSYKTTFFDDKSAYYIKRWGTDVLFIEYEPASDKTPTYIYRIKKSKRLRGFFGV